MNHALSRRIAQALHKLPAGELTLDQRVQLAEEAEPCGSFTALPKWIRDVIKKGEDSA